MDGDNENGGRDPGDLSGTLPRDAAHTDTLVPGATGGGNRPSAVAEPDTGTDDPHAYRDRGRNGYKRMEHLERCVIDLVYGGSIRRFDEAAGLDFDA